jgi:hypothetical protein
MMEKIHFCNLPEFLTELREQRQRKYKGTRSAYLSAEQNQRDQDWTGGIKGFTDGAQYLTEGYTPFLEYTNAASHQQTPGAELVPSITGQFNDVGAYLQGRPDCMASFEEITPTRFADIVVNTAVSVHMAGTELMKRAAAVYNLINSAEAKNIKTRVTLAAVVEYNKKMLQVTMDIKSHRDRINPALFGFLLGHAGFTRVFFYSYLSLISTKKTIGAPRDYTGQGQEIVINLNEDNAEKIKNKLQ